MNESRKDELYSSIPESMCKVMLFGIILCIAFAVMYHRYGSGWMLSCAISFGIIAYHLLLRFLIPVVLTALFCKNYDYRAWWFRQKAWEPKFYDLLKVKSWKSHVITYDPGEFSMKLHSIEEIVNNMCHAELVHELGAIMSFTSLLFSIPFGSFAAFMTTAILAALFDALFVLLQRFNRPRLVAIMERRKNRSS